MMRLERLSCAGTGGRHEHGVGDSRHHGARDHPAGHCSVGCGRAVDVAVVCDAQVVMDAPETSQPGVHREILRKGERLMYNQYSYFKPRTTPSLTYPDPDDSYLFEADEQNHRSYYDYAADWDECEGVERDFGGE